MKGKAAKIRVLECRTCGRCSMTTTALSANAARKKHDDTGCSDMLRFVREATPDELREHRTRLKREQAERTRAKREQAKKERAST